MSAEHCFGIQEEVTAAGNFFGEAVLNGYKELCSRKYQNSGIGSDLR